MNWDTIKLLLKGLTEQFGFHRVRSDEYRDRRTNAETSISDQGTDEGSTPYHPDFREKRHEFSQHIGC
jgi:hypothetical protein